VPWTVGTGGNFAARVRALRDIGGWDERLGVGSPGRAGEDSELLNRLLAAGATVRYEPAAVVRHEWATRRRRRSTRWTYGYGIGAMCGLCARRQDRFAARMLTSYARLHAPRLLRALLRADVDLAVEHGLALVSVVPGVAYGLRAARRPPRPSGVAW
jgi:hypothetical protein